MGLDGVELILEVEETFGFSIPEDAGGFATVGSLYDYILAHRFEGRQEGCLTSVAFYKLRRALMSTLGTARSDVRVPSKLAAIIPGRRRRRWSDLEKAMGLRLPKLVRPQWVTAAATLAGFALFIIAATYLLASTVGMGILCLGWGGLLAYGLYQGTKPLAVAFRPEFATVGGLTKSILRLNYGAISDECQRVNAEDVWNTLCTLVAEQLGVPRNQLKRETDFVKDLGVD